MNGSAQYGRFAWVAALGLALAPSSAWAAVTPIVGQAGYKCAVSDCGDRVSALSSLGGYADPLGGAYGPNIEYKPVIYTVEVPRILPNEPGSPPVAFTLAFFDLGVSGPSAAAGTSFGDYCFGANGCDTPVLVRIFPPPTVDCANEVAEFAITPGAPCTTLQNAGVIGLMENCNSLDGREIGITVQPYQDEQPIIDLGIPQSCINPGLWRVEVHTSETVNELAPLNEFDDIDVYRFAAIQAPTEASDGSGSSCEQPLSFIRAFTPSLNLVRPSADIPLAGSLVGAIFYSDIRGGWAISLDASTAGLNLEEGDPLRFLIPPDSTLEQVFDLVNFPQSDVQTLSTPGEGSQSIRRNIIPFCFLGDAADNCVDYGEVAGYPVNVNDVDSEGVWAFAYGFQGFDENEATPTYVHTVTLPVQADDAFAPVAYPITSSSALTQELTVNRNAHAIYFGPGPGALESACNELPSGFTFDDPAPIPDLGSAPTPEERALKPRLIHRVRGLGIDENLGDGNDNGTDEVLRCYEQEIRVLTPPTELFRGTINNVELFVTVPNDPRLKFIDFSVCSVGVADSAEITREITNGPPNVSCEFSNAIDAPNSEMDPSFNPFDGDAQEGCPTSRDLFEALPDTAFEARFDGTGPISGDRALFVRYRFATLTDVGDPVFFTERDDDGTNPNDRGNRANWVDETVDPDALPANPGLPPPIGLEIQSIDLNSLSYGGSDGSGGTSTSGDGNDDPNQLATIDSVRAVADDRGARIFEFSTTSEILTGGFEVQVRTGDDEWQTLSPFLSTHPNRMSGIYRIALPLSFGERFEARILELELRGTKRVHGPYTLEVEAVREAPTVGPNGGFTMERPSLRSAAAPLVLHNPTAPPSNRAQFTVPVAGGYRIRYSTLAQALTASMPELASRAGRGQLRLTRNGRSVPYVADGNGIAFYASGEQGAGSTEPAFVVALGPGDQAPHAEEPARPLTPTGRMNAQRVWEQDLLPALATQSLYGDDYMMWAVLRAGTSTDAVFSHVFDAPGVLDEPAELTLAVRGGSQSTRYPDHGLQFRVNGEIIGNATFYGLDDRRFSIRLPAGLLQPEANVLEVESFLAPDLPFAIEWIDWLSLRYTRNTVAENDQLNLLASREGAVRVEGFTSSNIQAWIVSGSGIRNVLSVEPTEDGVGFSGTITTGFSSNERLFAFVPSSLPEIEMLQPLSGQAVREFRAGAEYVAVAHPALLEAAQALARHRETQGLSVAVFSVTDLYDTFTDGRADASALRDFLVDAERHWEILPSYLVIVGDGSFDLENAGGMNDNLIPIRMIESDAGFFGSDTSLGDLGARAGLEVAVGRIPAHSAEEVYDYIDKVRAFEDAANTVGAESAFLLADDPDDAGDFSVSLTEAIAALDGTLNVESAQLTPQSIASTREQLLSAIETGTRFLYYIGHGGILGLAGENVLTRDDVGGLANASSPMVLLAATCLVGRFGVPGLRTFSEALLLDGADGAAAVFASSALETNAQATLLNRILSEQLASRQHKRLGASLRDASELARGVGLSNRSLYLHTLLGDPALVLWPNAPEAAQRQRVAFAPMRPPGDRVAGDPTSNRPEDQAEEVLSGPRTSGCTSSSPTCLAFLGLVALFWRRRALHRGERQ